MGVPASSTHDDSRSRPIRPSSSTTGTPHIDASIKPEFLPHVFERFRQEDAYATRKSGGLGLSIVKHLVEMHAGLVEAASGAEGPGTTFTVRLPLATIRPSEPERLPAKENHPTLARSRISASSRGCRDGSVVHPLRLHRAR